MHIQNVKNRWRLAAGITFPMLAAAAGPQLDSFDPDQLHLVGSQCAFENKRDKPCWPATGSKNSGSRSMARWSNSSPANPTMEMQRQSDQKRWHDVLQAGELTLTLDLRKTGAHDDTATYKGRIELKQRGGVERLPVVGGCSA